MIQTPQHSSSPRVEAWGCSDYHPIPSTTALSSQIRWRFCGNLERAGLGADLPGTDSFSSVGRAQQQRALLLRISVVAAATPGQPEVPSSAAPGRICRRRAAPDGGSAPRLSRPTLPSTRLLGAQQSASAVGEMCGPHRGKRTDAAAERESNCPGLALETSSAACEA